jgi:hypothetical protein
MATHLYQSLLFGERRKFQRHRTLKPAKIVFNQNASVIDCMARNLSAAGARLQVPNVVTIPERFELVIGGARRSAKIVWRLDREIGVEFTGDKTTGQ